jgi:hypothetical protein
VQAGGTLSNSYIKNQPSTVENLTLVSGSTFIFMGGGSPLLVRAGAHGIGSVTLGGATLQLGISPVAAGTIMMIDNDGSDPVNGTFAGLPEGAVVTTYRNARARISYIGGDGNDVTLTITDNPYGDFDADGKSDILWRHFAPDGSIYLWGMNGYSIANAGEMSEVTDANWKVAGLGDFDGDGKADVLWRNTLTGENLVYLTATPFGAGPHYALQTINYVTDMNWDIAAVGDYNGDGKDDIFWRNNATGENLVYMMNGAAISYVDHPPPLDVAWKIVPATISGLTSRTGMLWRNSSTGEVYYWSTPYYSPSSHSVAVVDPQWVIAGVADFDRDGARDMLWRNQTTGEVYLYTMDRLGNVLSTGPVTTVSDLTWKIVGVGDYDGDGAADILWRNSATGENYLYLMDGRTIRQAGALPGLPDLNWKVVP